MYLLHFIMLISKLLVIGNVEFDDIEVDEVNSFEELLNNPTGKIMHSILFYCLCLK